MVDNFHIIEPIVPLDGTLVDIDMWRANDELIYIEIVGMKKEVNMNNMLCVKVERVQNMEDDEYKFDGNDYYDVCDNEGIYEQFLGDVLEDFDDIVTQDFGRNHEDEDLGFVDGKSYERGESSKEKFKKWEIKGFI